MEEIKNESLKANEALVWLYHRIEELDEYDFNTLDNLIEDAIQMDRDIRLEHLRRGNNTCIEASSWETADKINFKGYIYVRSADLKFCNDKSNQL